MKQSSRFLLPALALLVVGCTPSPDSTATIPDEAQNAWVTSFNARNATALEAIYTEDCVLLPPNGAIAKGREAVLPVFVEGMKKGFKISQANQEIKIAGDTAYRYGTYQVKDNAGKEIDHGKYVEIWRKQADGWKISHDIWNTSVPVITPPMLIQ